MSGGVVGPVTPTALGALLGLAVEASRGRTGEEDIDEVGPMLREARTFGSQAFDAALALLASEDVVERTVAYEVLATLCNPDDEQWGPAVATVVLPSQAGVDRSHGRPRRGHP